MTQKTYKTIAELIRTTKKGKTTIFTYIKKGWITKTTDGYQILNRDIIKNNTESQLIHILREELARKDTEIIALARENGRLEMALAMRSRLAQILA